MWKKFLLLTVSHSICDKLTSSGVMGGGIMVRSMMSGSRYSVPSAKVYGSPELSSSCLISARMSSSLFWRVMGRLSGECRPNDDPLGFRTEEGRCGGLITVRIHELP